MTPGLVATASDEAIYLSKTLSKLLSEVYARHKAVLIDLGPAIGSNISYLGELVGCKIHVGDLYADLDRHAREVAREAESLACSAPLPEPCGDKNQNVLVSRRDRSLPAKNSIRRRRANL